MKLLILLLTPYFFFPQVITGIIKYRIAKYNNTLYKGNSILAAKDLICILKFNETASIFEADRSMALDLNSFENILITAGCTGKFFKESSKSSYIKAVSDDLFGDIIINYDAHIDWQLSTESKTIANYKCFKATCKKKDFGPPGRDNMLEIVAWYCPSIPVSIGPKGLYGLPGLILQAEEPTRQLVFTAESVSLNMTKIDIITAPDKGKSISEAEYRKLVEDEIAEMYK